MLGLEYVLLLLDSVPFKFFHRAEELLNEDSDQVKGIIYVIDPGHGHVHADINLSKPPQNSRIYLSTYHQAWSRVRYEARYEVSS